VERQHARWSKTIFWGVVTALLYAAMFYYADVVQYVAHTTPDACVVGEGANASYFHSYQVDEAACAAKGGHVEQGTWWHVLLPILIAFAVSYAHGAFTGLFWDVMGLKPARQPDKAK